MLLEYYALYFTRKPRSVSTRAVRTLLLLLSIDLLQMEGSETNQYFKKKHFHRFNSIKIYPCFIFSQ